MEIKGRTITGKEPFSCFIVSLDRWNLREDPSSKGYDQWLHDTGSCKRMCKFEPNHQMRWINIPTSWYPILDRRDVNSQVSPFHSIQIQPSWWSTIQYLTIYIRPVQDHSLAHQHLTSPNPSKWLPTRLFPLFQRSFFRSRCSNFLLPKSRTYWCIVLHIILLLCSQQNDERRGKNTLVLLIGSTMGDYCYFFSFPSSTINFPSTIFILIHHLNIHSLISSCLYTIRV